MDWTCRFCTFDNDLNTLYCLICQAGKPEAIQEDAGNHILNALNNLHIAPRNYQPPLDFLPLNTVTNHDDNANSGHSLSYDLQNETENDHIFNEINTYCQLTNTTFIDENFPHSKRSIGDTHRFKNLPRNIVWLRPADIVARDRYPWDVFRDPSPLDIKQGAVGNCWLISCIALIAERPDILDKIILTKTYNPNGIYKIRLCVDGIYVSVYVDDYFPCNSETRKMLFVQGRHNQLWPSLIEKALAKLLGNYEALISGPISEGLAFLTGAPCKTIKTEINYGLSESLIEYEKHKIWSRLCSAKDANFLVGAGCGTHKDGIANKRDFEIVGLVKQHAYSILDVRHYNDHKLILLRNPWDNFTWKGEWGRDWRGWTDAARRDLQVERNDQKGGTFWMPFDSFLRYFDSVEVAYIREYSGWKEQRFLLEISPKHCETLHLILTERTEICLNVFQKNMRNIDDKADVVILLHKNEGGQPGQLVSNSKRRHTSSILLKDTFCEAGDYIIIVISIMAICNEIPLSCALAVHSSKPVTVFPQEENPEIFRKSLIQLALSQPPKKQTFPNMLLYKVEGFNGFLYMAENYDEEMYFQIKLDATNSRNVSSSRNALVVADCIPPMHRQLLIILSTSKTTEHSTFMLQTTFRQSHSFYLHQKLTPKTFCLHSPEIQLSGIHATTPIF